MGKYFGTDGVRGIANKELTAELAFQIGRCGGYVLAGQAPKPKVVIGMDTRISGVMLESAIVAGLLSIGADVVRLGVVTTPAVAYLTRLLKADAGVMISASHNPVEDNGIKFSEAMASSCRTKRSCRSKNCWINLSTNCRVRSAADWAT
ncbi:hypothetical protein HMSSN036_68010 [Paenibacillus macerans]|nr:hypothetical protein HMSSN036_68010 [Paenibacillus macerans]